MWHHIKEDSLSPNSGTETCKKQYTFLSMCNEFQQEEDKLHVWSQAFQYLTILLMHCFLHTVLIALPTSPHPLSQLPSTWQQPGSALKLVTFPHPYLYNVCITYSCNTPNYNNGLIMKSKFVPSQFRQETFFSPSALILNRKLIWMKFSNVSVTCSKLTWIPILRKSLTASGGKWSNQWEASANFFISSSQRPRLCIICHWYLPLPDFATALLWKDRQFQTILAKQETEWWQH